MRVQIVKLNGFWHLLDTKNNALIAVKGKAVIAKTKAAAERNQFKWEEAFKLQEVYQGKQD